MLLLHISELQGGGVSDEVCAPSLEKALHGVVSESAGGKKHQRAAYVTKRSSLGT